MSGHLGKHTPPFHPCPPPLHSLEQRQSTRVPGQRLLGDNGNGDLPLVAAGSVAPQLPVRCLCPHPQAWIGHSTSFWLFLCCCPVRTIPQIGSFIREKKWLLMAPKTGKSKVRVPSGPVSSEGCFLLSRWCLGCSNPLQGMLCPLMVEDKGQRTNSLSQAPFHQSQSIHKGYSILGGPPFPYHQELSFWYVHLRYVQIIASGHADIPMNCEEHTSW